ncbi:MAG: hypothetical protein AB7G28_11050 [Pirellulales bacterium]
MSHVSAIRLVVTACALGWTGAVAASGLIFYDAATGMKSVEASAASPLELWRPRLNDVGEIVWQQQLTFAPNTFAIFSNVRGQLAVGAVADPDINNLGEVIWRFGDGGSGQNGIESNVKGVILLSSGQDPYYDTQRLNNLGEVVATRNGGVQGVWSNERGYLPTLGQIARETEINDIDEVVYQSYDNIAGESYFRIQSTVRGTVSASDWATVPDINNLGEIVWQQSIRPSGNGPHWEIWSNLRGKIGNGEQPSINDLGEVVWQFWDGSDYEIYSSVRGQITSNDEQDEWPQVNNRGDIVWKQSGVPIAPEPSSILFATCALPITLGRLRRGA